MKNLFIVFALVSFMSLKAQTESKDVEKINNPFLIDLKIENNKLFLTSDKGTAWTELSFSMMVGKEQMVDFYGMTSSGECTDDSKFCFVIKRTQNGLSFKSNKGTAWTDLSFNLPDGRIQAIDNYGMVTR